MARKGDRFLGGQALNKRAQPLLRRMGIALLHQLLARRQLAGKAPEEQKLRQRLKRRDGDLRIQSAHAARRVFQYEQIVRPIKSLRVEEQEAIDSAAALGQHAEGLAGVDFALRFQLAVQRAARAFIERVPAGHLERHLPAGGAVERPRFAQQEEPFGQIALGAAHQAQHLAGICLAAGAALGLPLDCVDLRAHGVEQLLRGKGLGQEGVRMVFQRAHGVVEPLEGRNHDNARAAARLAQKFENPQAACAAHFDVGDQYVHIVRLEIVHERAAGLERRGDFNAREVLRQHAAEAQPDLFLIVGNRDGNHARASLMPFYRLQCYQNLRKNPRSRKPERKYSYKTSNFLPFADGGAGLTIEP